MSAVSNSVMPRSSALWMTLRGRLEVDAAAEIVAAEPDGRDAQARLAEVALLHPIFPHAQPRKLANSRAGTRSVLSAFSGAAVSS